MRATRNSRVANFLLTILLLSAKYRPMEMREWLKIATPDQREQVAASAGTKVSYLFQIAGGHRTPSPHLARRIDTATNGSVSRAELRPDIFDCEPAAA